MQTAESVTRDAEEQMQADHKRLLRLIEQSMVREARALAPVLAEKWPESRPIQHLAWVLEPPIIVPNRLGLERNPLEREYGWLREHGGKYPGCYIALYGDQLIAADPNVGRVRRAAREAFGDEFVLIHHQRANPK